MELNKYIGEKVVNKKKQVGILVEIGDYIIIQFDDKEREYELKAFENGFLKFVDLNIQKEIESQIKLREEEESTTSGATTTKSPKEDETKEGDGKEKETEAKEVEDKVVKEESREKSKFCKFKIGCIYKNNEIVKEFKCANMGGMRFSKTTNSLVLICDHTKELYDDEWINGLLHYTGMGKTGDQDLYYRQNKTLLESRLSGIEVHLFEVKNPGDYEYRGQVYLADKVYQEEQRDDNGFIRKVWMFPLALK